jgi:GT2 family glycosyltransferase
VRVRWPLPDPPPLVSVLIPTRDRAELLGPCVAGLLGATAYPALEVLVVDNGSERAETFALFESWKGDARVQVLPAPGPFNYARLNNQAAAAARGDILLLLNNDTEVTEPGWLAEMVSLALRPEVGAVGARLLYPDGTLQHAGVVLGFGWPRGVAGHVYLAEPGDHLGERAMLGAVRGVSAVTAACLAVRREAYLAVGGMDEESLAVAFNDVDFCLKLGARGLRNLWTPFATLLHKESASRGRDLDMAKAARLEREVAVMRARWGALLDEDPHWNPNLSLLSGGRDLAAEPRARTPRRGLP